MFFLRFSVQIRLDTQLRARKNILYTILSVTSFFVNYNKSHKLQLKYEFEYNLYKISPKNKKPKNPKFWTLEVFKNLVFFERSHFPAPVLISRQPLWNAALSIGWSTVDGVHIQKVVSASTVVLHPLLCGDVTAPGSIFATRAVFITRSTDRTDLSSNQRDDW